jgi:hypothetical protein
MKKLSAFDIPCGGGWLDLKAKPIVYADGSESGNTWMVGQNTAATIPLGGAARVRFMLQATGDPAATTYQLEFRKVGDATWKKVSP